MRSWALLLLAVFATPLHAVERITLHALFKDKAIFIIDGARRVLEKGATSPEGVRLVATDTSAEQAEVEVEGKRQTVKLGTITAAFKTGARASVTLYASNGGHFFADGAINDLPVRFMVDTGATMIAMSGDEARRLGIDFRKKGRAGYASTAGGTVRTYGLVLDKVDVGPITLYNVDAGVIEGAYPREVLLGMSFLGRLNMKREGDQMELTVR